ncbi:MAG: ATP-dependent helicase, partial [Helicobacter sp.]|nr:ATP-dependent helicase [Helicobacter sp.]
LRVINKPKRGIGKTTIEKLVSLSKLRNCSIYELFVAGFDGAGTIGTKTYNVLEEFFNTLRFLQEALKNSSMGFIDIFESKIGLCEAFNKSNEEVNRVGNIQEFYALYKEYVKENPLCELEDFLNDLALRSDQEDVEMRQKNKGIEGVSCMSVHSSKGLEFDYVFIIGLEEGFFPLLKEDSSLEEERRLGYVAFTRAKKELYLCYVDSRFYKGNRANLPPSRFLQECGAIQEGRAFVRSNEDFANDVPFKKGDCVFHKIFGAGKILKVVKSGKEIQLSINFGGLIRNVLSSYVQKV